MGRALKGTRRLLDGNKAIFPESNLTRARETANRDPHHHKTTSSGL